MSELHTVTRDGFTIGSADELKSDQIDSLCRFFRKSVLGQAASLGGRAPVHREDLGGPVIIKHYRRGGWAAVFFSGWYLRFGKTRSEREFELLREARKVGVNAPEPIAFASHGTFFYKTWLITKEVIGAISLAELSVSDEDRCRALMPEVASQIRLLISNDLCHSDLHPGNVIVDPANRLFLIDFDKAYYTQMERRKLRDIYFCRWRRAVIKHRLPEYLSECMGHGLRQSIPERSKDGVSAPSRVR